MMYTSIVVLMTGNVAVGQRLYVRSKYVDKLSLTSGRVVAIHGTCRTNGEVCHCHQQHYTNVYYSLYAQAPQLLIIPIHN